MGGGDTVTVAGKVAVYMCGIAWPCVYGGLNHLRAHLGPRKERQKFYLMTII